MLEHERSIIQLDVVRGELKVEKQSHAKTSAEVTELKLGSMPHLVSIWRCSV